MGRHGVEVERPVARLAHDALLYHDHRELVHGIVAFVEPGLAAGEPVMMAAPADHLALVRTALGAAAGAMRFADMADVGRNPARIIPFLRDWVDGHAGSRLRFVGEPCWPGRGHGELVEGERHEALLNVAFADVPVSILCPYDATLLAPRVLAGARSTHPTLVSGGIRRASDAYVDPLEVYAAREHPLPAPPVTAGMLEIGSDLGAVRAFIRRHAAEAELDDRRLADLLVAVNEAATNVLLHGRAPAVLRVWHDDDALVCEVVDGGRIVDPLAGRRRPDGVSPNGRGLWLINQLCDLVQLRSAESGTIVRLHMRVAA